MHTCTHWKDKETILGAFDDAAESVIDKWGVKNMLLTHIQEGSQTHSLFYPLLLTVHTRALFHVFSAHLVS